MGYNSSVRTEILQTKLYTPKPKPTLISRPRLIERLNDGLSRQLIVVSAPAGFGKTSLLAEWGVQISALNTPLQPAIRNPKLGWLSLDRGDNDPVRFWAYLIAALQKIRPSLGAGALVMLEASSPQAVSIETVLTSLINDIAQEPAAFALVLDDYHLIESHTVHDALNFLVEHLPPPPGGLTLIIASRTDPPLRLPRLRAQDELVELRAADLAFSVEETAVFLQNATGLTLSAQETAALKTRTEGWIAGLQMAALSMQGRDPETIPDFIRSFTGSHYYILDYLTDEVLQQQPEHIQSFLLLTSILNHLNGPLCDAVTGFRDETSASAISNLQSVLAGQLILEQLESANLFLVPLDDERRWYRYHHLFADLLRSRLEQMLPDQIPTLHRRASAWYESQGLIVEAVGHALAAGDVDWIERLVAENALALSYHGELATVIGWLDALDDEVVRSRPRLGVAYAWTLAYAGRFKRVEPLLQEAEKALADLDENDATPVLSTGERQCVVGQITAVRAYVAALKGDMSCAAPLARKALDLLPATELTMRGWTTLLLGCALRSQGDLTAASQVFDTAVAINRTTGNIYLEVDTLWEYAVLQLMRGQLHRVMRTCEEALQVANQYASCSGRQLPVTGYTYTLMGRVLCQWNDLEAALRYVKEGVSRCRQWGQADALTQGYFHLAGVLYAAGEIEEALEVIQAARQAARELGRWYVVTAGAYEARIRLAQGNIAAATRWLPESGLSVDDELSLELCSSYLTLARILMVQGQLVQALGLAERLLQMAEAAGAVGPTIEILVFQSLVLQAKNQDEGALTSLARALSLAEPEGYVRVFIGEGPPMYRLLEETAVRGIAAKYVAKLLSEFGVGVQDKSAIRIPSTSLRTGPQSALIEPLSQRELEVLRLLAAGRSNKGIAQTLVIAVGTVKKHLKNIYQKLNVHSRTAAVARARELDILKNSG